MKLWSLTGILAAVALTVLIGRRVLTEDSMATQSEFDTALQQLSDEFEGFRSDLDKEIGEVLDAINRNPNVPAGAIEKLAALRVKVQGEREKVRAIVKTDEVPTEEPEEPPVEEPEVPAEGNIPVGENPVEPNPAAFVPRGRK